MLKTVGNFLGGLRKTEGIHKNGDGLLDTPHVGQALPGLASVGKALGWEGQEASTHIALQVCSWTCSRPTSWELARNAHPLKRIASETWGGGSTSPAASAPKDSASSFSLQGPPLMRETQHPELRFLAMGPGSQSLGP